MAIDYAKLLADLENKPRPKTRLGRTAQTEGGDFSKGVARGIDQTQALGYGLASLAGDAVDLESLQRFGLEGYKRNMQEAEKNKARIGRIEDIDWELGKAIDWGQGILGELVPSIATMALGGGIGGAIAKKAAKTAVEKQLAKKIATGKLAGVTGASIGMETGEIYGDVAQEGHTGAKAIGASILGGTIAGTLDTILPMQVAKKLGLAGGLKKEITKTMLKNAKKRGLKGRMGIEALKGMGTEGATEFAQTAIEEATKSFIKNEGLPENIGSQLLNSTAAGMLGGGVLGSAAGIPKGPIQEAVDKQERTERTDVNPVTQEEYGSTKVAKYGEQLAKIDKAIKESTDEAQKASLTQEAAAIIDDMELEYVNPPKQVDKDGKAKEAPRKSAVETKEVKDLLEYYGPSYKGKADIEITDVAPETTEQRQARIKEEASAKRAKSKLDKVREAGLKEANEIATEEAAVEKEVLQETLQKQREDINRVVAEIQKIVRPQAGDDPKTIAAMLDKEPPVAEETDDVPAFLKDREGIPPKNGLLNDTQQQEPEAEVPSETDDTGDDVVVGQEDLVTAPVDPEVVEQEATIATTRREPELEAKIAQGVSGETVKSVPDDYDKMVIENVKKLIQADNTDRTNINNFLAGFDEQTGLDFSSRSDELIATAIDELVADTQKPRAQQKQEEAPKGPALDNGEVARRLDELPLAQLRKALAGKGVKGISKMKKADLLEQIMERMDDPDVSSKASDALRTRDAKGTVLKQAKEKRETKKKEAKAKIAGRTEEQEIEAATREVWDDSADDLYKQAERRKQAEEIAKLREPKEGTSATDSEGIPDDDTGLTPEEQKAIENAEFERKMLEESDDFGTDLDNFPDDDYSSWSPDRKRETSERLQRMKFIGSNYTESGVFLDRQDTERHRAYSKHVKTMQALFDQMVKKIRNPKIDNLEFEFITDMKQLQERADHIYVKQSDGTVVKKNWKELKRANPSMLHWRGLFVPSDGTRPNKVYMNPAQFFEIKDPPTAGRFSMPQDSEAAFKWVMLHEVVSHYGLRRLFDVHEGYQSSVIRDQRNKWEVFLDKVRDTNPDILAEALTLRHQWGNIDPMEDHQWGGVRTMKDSQGETVKITDTAIRKLLEEYISERAGEFSNPALNAKWTKSVSTLMKRVMAWVKHKLGRYMGIHNAKVTDDDVMGLIAQSHNNLFGRGIVQPNVERALGWAKRFGKASSAQVKRGKIEADLREDLAKGKESTVFYSPEPEGYNKAVDDGVVNNEGADQKAERIAALEALRDKGIDVSDILAVEAVQAPGYGELRQNAVSKTAAQYYKKLQSAFPGFFQVMTPRGNLQKYDMKNAQAMKALGKMGKHFTMAKEASTLLKNLSSAQGEAVIEFMTDDRGNIENINLPPKTRNALVKYKEEIVQLGEKLVQLGLLNPESYAANEGKYLPLRYLAYASRATGAGRKASPLDYLRKRNPNINDEQQTMMGEIADPQFIIPEALSLIGRDVALLEYMETIRTLDKEANLGWILGDKSIERYNAHANGLPAEVSVLRAEELLQMHKDILADYAAGNLTTQATEADIREHAAAVEWYEKSIGGYKQRLEQRVKGLAGVPLDIHLPESEWSKALGDRYKKMPDDAGYGALRGQWVRTEIHDEFNESKWFQEDLAGISKAVGPGGWVDRGNQLWKTMKVPFNLPSWLRNGIGNFVLMDIATNTKFSTLMGMLIEETQLAMNANPSRFWAEAHKRGLFGTTFSSNEIFLLSEQASVARKIRIAQELKKKNTFKSSLMKSWGAFVEVSELASQGYGNLEGIFKTVAMRDYVTRWQKENNVKSLEDLSPEQREAVLNESVIHANKAIFDYSELTAWQKDLRRNALGAPFITYTMKALPAVARGLGQNPQKFIKYLALPYAFAGMAAMGLSDVSPEELEEWNTVQPQWMKDKSSVYVLPMKDSNGKLQPMDFGYWFPWAPWQDLAMKTMSNFKGKEGVMEYTRATYESAWEGVNSLGLLGGPLPTTIAALTTGKETFLGRDIVDAGDSASVAMAKQFNWLYTMWAPPFLTNQGVAGKLMDHFDASVLGLPNQNVDAFGGQKATLGSTLLRGAGVSVYPTSLQEAASRRQKNYKRQIRDLQTAKRRAIKNRGWAQERRVQEVRDINRRMQILRQKHSNE